MSFWLNKFVFLTLRSLIIFSFFLPPTNMSHSVDFEILLSKVQQSYLAQAMVQTSHLSYSTGYKRVRQLTLPAETVCDLLLPDETTVQEKCLPAETVRVILLHSWQEAKSHGQSLQKAIYRAQQSQQEVRDHGQFRWKPNMTDSFCRKR